MTTFDFQVHMTGNVRIDAATEDEARAEFTAEFAQEPVLVTAQRDQIVVLSGLAWEEPTIYTEPAPDDQEGVDEDEEEDLG